MNIVRSKCIVEDDGTVSLTGFMEVTASVDPGMQAIKLAIQAAQVIVTVVAGRWFMQATGVSGWIGRVSSPVKGLTFSEHVNWAKFILLNGVFEEMVSENVGSFYGLAAFEAVGFEGWHVQFLGLDLDFSAQAIAEQIGERGGRR